MILLTSTRQMLCTFGFSFICVVLLLFIYVADLAYFVVLTLLCLLCGACFVFLTFLVVLLCVLCLLYWCAYFVVRALLCVLCFPHFACCIVVLTLVFLLCCALLCLLWVPSLLLLTLRTMFACLIPLCLLRMPLFYFKNEKCTNKHSEYNKRTSFSPRQSGKMFV